MPGAGKVTVQVAGIPQLKAKLRNGGDRLFDGPMVAGFDLIGFAGEDAVRDAAPVRTGNLRSKVTHKLSGARPVPSFVSVIDMAVSRPTPGGRRRNRTTGRIGRPY